MAERDLAEILSGRNATLEMEDGDMVTDAVVLCRISGANGETRIGMSITEGTSWLDQFGMVKAAGNILDFAAWTDEDDD